MARQDRFANVSKRVLDINSDLSSVVNACQECAVQWNPIGLELGLVYAQLQQIAAITNDPQGRLQKVLAAWLMKNTRSGSPDPSYYILCHAVAKRGGNPALAERIAAAHPASADIEVTGVVKIKSSTVYILPEYIKEMYTRMNGKFAGVLFRAAQEAISEVDLEEIQLFLKANCPDEASTPLVHNVSDLVAFLRKHCFLSNFGMLQSLSEEFKLVKSQEDMKTFSTERDDFYKSILAEDFAKKAIEDHQTMDGQQEITFKVSWQLTTTLYEFEAFLRDVFHRNKILIFISLRAVHQSLLTFICTIPNWLVDEMILFVKENRNLLKLRGVVEVSVNKTIIRVDFSVEHPSAAEAAEPRQKTLPLTTERGIYAAVEAAESRQKTLPLTTETGKDALDISDDLLETVSQQVLDTTSLVDVFQTCQECAVKWNPIGLQLGLAYSRLEEIDEAADTSKKKLQKVLAAWLKKDTLPGSPDPSYYTLCHAVAKGGGNPALADRIAAAHPASADGTRSTAQSSVIRDTTLPVYTAASSGKSPKGIFLKALPRLSGPLGKEPNFTNVTNLLLGGGLITKPVLSGIKTQRNQTDNQRGSEVAHALLDKIKASDDPVRCLLEICDVLEDDLVGDDALKKHGANMRSQLPYTLSTDNSTVLTSHISKSAAEHDQSPVYHRAGLRERKRENSQQSGKSELPHSTQKKLSKTCWIFVITVVIGCSCVGGFMIYKLLPQGHYTQNNQPSGRSSYSSHSTTEVPATMYKDELKITQLEDVKRALKDNNFDNTKWKDVGLSLGLYLQTLNDFERDSKGVKECLLKTLEAWLERQDNVDKRGGATWSSLTKALRDNGSKAVAEGIEKYFANG